MFDLAILNGRVYLERDWIEGNIYIKNQKIDTISKEYLPCKEEYDAKGNMVLPGLIDAHVHFSLTVGKHTSKDDFYTGSKAAAFAGITTYIDFLDPVKNSVQLEQAFRTRRALADRSVVDFAFHSTIAQPEEHPETMIDAMTSLGIPTVKLFTTYSSSQRRTYDDYIDRLLTVSKEKAVRVLVHAENEELLEQGENIPVEKHEKARPALSEITEVLKLAAMTQYRDGLLYIVHTNCGTTVEKIKALYPDLLHKSLILESCPHYFTFPASIYETDRGYLYTMTPPLRSQAEVNKLCEEIDRIDVMATDHCPFTNSQKNHSMVNQIPMGIGGVDYSFFRMYKMFGQNMIDKFTINPAKIHGLYPRKGTLLPGADGDLMVFDPDVEWTAGVEQREPEEKDGPYIGVPMKGKVVCTVSKGEFIVKDGIFMGGQGRYLERELIKL